jgi:hypothetical protein
LLLMGHISLANLNVFKIGHYLHKILKPDINLRFSSRGNSRRIYAGM